MTKTLTQMIDDVVTGMDTGFKQSQAYRSVRAEWDRWTGEPPQSERLWYQANRERLQPRFDAAEASAVSEGNRLHELGSSALQMAQETIAPPTLTDAELQRAAAQREFVREDAERLGADELVKRIQYARNVNDRAGLYLLARYATNRTSYEQRQAMSPNARAAEDHLQSLLAEVSTELADATALGR